MSEKQTGYGLLILGVICMITALSVVLMTFTGIIGSIPIFNNLTDLASIGSIPNPYNIGPNQNTSSPLSSFDPKTLAEILNLTTTLFLMGFLMNFGYKLSTLGTSLLRPINVRMKNRDLESDEQLHSIQIEAKK